MPEQSKNEQSNFVGTSTRSAEMCRDFLKGMCSRGQNCKFSHNSPREFRESADSPLICRDFLAGKCYRANCKFSHEIPQQSYRKREYERDHDMYNSDMRNPYPRERMERMERIQRPHMERPGPYEADPPRQYNGGNWYREPAYPEKMYKEFDKMEPSPPLPFANQPQYENNDGNSKNRGAVSGEPMDNSFAYKGNASPYYPTAGQMSAKEPIPDSHFNKPLVFEAVNPANNAPAPFPDNKEYIQSLEHKIDFLMRENQELRKELSSLKQYPGNPMRSY